MGKKGTPQGDVRNLGLIRASNIPFVLAWRVDRDEYRPKTLIIKLMDIENYKAFPYPREGHSWARKYI